MNMFDHLYKILLGLFTEYRISNAPDFRHHHHRLEFVCILSHNDTSAAYISKIVLKLISYIQNKHSSIKDYIVL